MPQRVRIPLQAVYRLLWSTDCTSRAMSSRSSTASAAPPRKLRMVLPMVLLLYFPACLHEGLIEIIEPEECPEGKQRQGPGKPQGVLSVKVLPQKKPQKHGSHCYPCQVPDLSKSSPQISVVEFPLHKGIIRRKKKKEAVKMWWGYLKKVAPPSIL